MSSVARLKRISRRSLCQEIIEQLTDLIAKGALKPGEQLPPERELCRQLGVGRSSLREAVRSLLIMGILDVQVGKGTYVAKPVDGIFHEKIGRHFLINPKTVTELIEARLVLECSIASMAAQRSNSDELKQIETNVRAMETSVQHGDTDLGSFDLQFHLAIAEASGNRILHGMLSTVRSYLSEWHERSLALPGSSDLVLKDHRGIYEAIASRDAARSQQLMFEHISRFMERYQRAYGDPQRLEPKRIQMTPV